MRPIDADALKDLMVEVLTNIKNNPRMDGQEKHIIAAMSMLGEMIDDAPTVEPERKTGRWDLYGGDEGIMDAFRCAVELASIKSRDKPQCECEWIPATERLPDERNIYLVSLDDGYSPITYVAMREGGRWVSAEVWNDIFLLDDTKITAWKPLPKPFGKTEQVRDDDERNR